MLDRTFLVYCLACHRVMNPPGPVCPRCGAEQEAVRAKLMEPPKPIPRGKFRRPKMPPPLPLNALEDVPCPTCKVPVPAGAPSCTYCGHTMLTDLPKWQTDEQVARKWGTLAIIFVVVGVLSAPVSLFVLCVSILIAIACAFFGFGENPFSWSSTLLMAVVTTIGMFLVIVLFVMAFLGANG